MQKKIFFSSFFVLVSIVYLCTGCSWHNHYVKLHQPKITTYDSSLLPFTVKVIDLRKQDDVGHTRNFLGMKITRILTKEPLTKTVENTFKNYYTLSKDSHQTLEITIRNCYTNYDDKLFQRKTTTTLKLQLVLKTAYDKVLFSKDIEVEASASPWLFFSTKTVAKALDKALAIALKEITALAQSGFVNNMAEN